MAAQSGAWPLSARTLESWVQILVKAWMFVPHFSVLCCPVYAEALRRADHTSKESYQMSKAQETSYM
jgi:hypothetical protein